jgi:hypothetical protein
MIQNKLLKPGATIVVHALPHTPPIGVIEVSAVEHGLVVCQYRRNDEAEGREVKLPRSHCEWMIVNGHWSDPEAYRDLPRMNESQIDGLHDEDNLRIALRDVATHATWWLERHDNEQVRAHLRQMLDNALETRVAEMRGETHAGT